MATEVELSGMTINLVPDKATYDGMVKNPNEMYLVQDDYDMVITINHVQGSSDFQPRIVSGSFQDIVEKLESEDNYVPKVLLKEELYYGTILTTSKQVATPWLTYGGTSKELTLITPWVFHNTHAYVSLLENGRLDVGMTFMSIS